MDVTFETRLHSCMEPVLREIHTSEQTQQISLPDGMPDIGQVLGAWGQPLLRGKQWQAEEVSCNGGLMVWALYAPEDGSPARCLEGWIPFTLRWDLPQEKPEGSLRLNCLCRFVDARVVSARKLVVRGGLGVQVEAFCPMEAASWEPEQVPPDVQLLRRECPVRLPKEMAEKSFLPGRGADPAGIRPSPSGADLLPADPVGDGQEGSLREGGVPGQCAGARSLPQHRGAAP